LKIPAYEEILRKAGMADPYLDLAHVGDDLPDLPVMRRAGLAGLGKRGSGGQKDGALRNES